jgi:MFS family permease
MSERRVLAVCSARVLLFATFMTVAATIPLLTTAWGLSATAAGAIISSFTVGYAASVFGFALIADRVGAKRMVVVSAIAASVASLAFGLIARDWTSAMVLYGVLGLSQGGLYTPLVMVFSDEIEPTRLGTAMGRLISSTSVGYATSLGAAGIGAAIAGWQGAFLLTGMLPAIGAVVLIWSLRPLPNRIHNRPRETRLSDELFRKRETRLLFTGYLGHSWELLGMWAWMPAFFAAAFLFSGMEVGGASASGAYVSGGLHLFGAVAALTMGRLSDRVGRRPTLIALAGASAIASFAIGWLVHAPLVLLVPLAIAYAFTCIGDSPVLTTAISEVVKPGFRGAVLAWRGLAGFAAGAVAPLAVGAVIDGAGLVTDSVAITWGLGFATLGVGGAIALVSAVLLRRHPVVPSRAT